MFGLIWASLFLEQNVVGVIIEATLAALKWPPHWRVTFHSLHSSPSHSEWQCQQGTWATESRLLLLLLLSLRFSIPIFFMDSLKSTWGVHFHQNITGSFCANKFKLNLKTYILVHRFLIGVPRRSHKYRIVPMYASFIRVQGSSYGISWHFGGPWNLFWVLGAHETKKG